MLESQRALFAIPKDLAYFNCASLAPLMSAAVEAGENALRRRSEPWCISTPDWFEAVERRRSLFCRLVGTSVENVALVPATSYGLATAAKNLTARPDQGVLIIAEDYPSNVYTWRAFCDQHGCKLVTAQRQAGQNWTDTVLTALDERTAIVAVPNVHWTDGALLDLHAIADRVRNVGAKLVVDASQSLGAMPFDFDAIRPDFLVTVGYKWLLGPFGLGYLYVADRHLEGRPLEENWISRAGSDDFARLIDYRDDYQAGARRFDVGARAAFEATPVAVAVLGQLVEWGVEEISTTLAAKTGRIAREAMAQGIPLSCEGPRGPHMLGLALPPETLVAAAQKLKTCGVYVGVRGSSIRVSPHVYTDEADIDRLINVLSKLEA